MDSNCEVEGTSEVDSKSDESEGKGIAVVETLNASSGLVPDVKVELEVISSLETSDVEIC